MSELRAFEEMAYRIKDTHNEQSQEREATLDAADPLSVLISFSSNNSCAHVKPQLSPLEESCMLRLQSDPPLSPRIRKESDLNCSSVYVNSNYDKLWTFYTLTLFLHYVTRADNVKYHAMF